MIKLYRNLYCRYFLNPLLKALFLSDNIRSIIVTLVIEPTELFCQSRWRCHFNCVVFLHIVWLQFIFCPKWHVSGSMLSQCKNCGAQFNIAAGDSELFRYLALPCGRQLFTHCPYWWSSNGPDYSIGMRPSPTNMWASHNSPQASCFVTHAECWCEDDTVCAALENSIVVVPKVSYIFFHVPVQMFVLESAMLHFLTTICFALPVCLFGL